MGIQDRQYYRDDPRNPYGAGISGPAAGSAVGSMRLWSVTTWLIVINVAVFVIDALLYRAGIVYVLGAVFNEGGVVDAIVSFERYEALAATGRMQGWTAMGPIQSACYFSFTKAVGSFAGVVDINLQLWRWISFQFIHANLGHIIGNMLGLYFFGPLIEQRLGRRRFLAFYLLCGIAGPIVYLFFGITGILGMSLASPMVGASAGVFGILLAAAQIAPRATVMLLFPPIPMQLRTLAIVLLVIAAYTVFTSGHNAGGEAAHLGGAALGAFLIRRPEWLNWAEGRILRLAPHRGGDDPPMRYHGWR